MQYKIKKDNEECGFSVKQITFLEKLINIERKDWPLKLSCVITYVGKKKEAKPKEPKEEKPAATPPKEEETQSEAVAEERLEDDEF